MIGVKYLVKSNFGLSFASSSSVDPGPSLDHLSYR